MHTISFIFLNIVLGFMMFLCQLINRWFFLINKRCLLRKPTATNLLILQTFSAWVIGNTFYHLIINTFHNMFELKNQEVNLKRCLGQLAKDNSLQNFSEWWNSFTWPRTLPISFEKIARLSVIFAFRHRHRHWHSGASGFV